jgi:hypothetical protein
MTRILILEDDVHLCKGISKAPAADGRAFLPCRSIAAAKSESHRSKFFSFLLFCLIFRFSV